MQRKCARARARLYAHELCMGASACRNIRTVSITKREGEEGISLQRGSLSR